MGATNIDVLEFQGLLESQVSRIERSDFNENLTVVFVKCDSENIETIKETLEPVLRQSDMFFAGHDYFFMLLPVTDKVGALHLDEMLKEFLNQNIVYAFATLPEDGTTSAEIISSIAKICDDEFTLDLYDYIRLLS